MSAVFGVIADSWPAAALMAVGQLGRSTINTMKPQIITIFILVLAFADSVTAAKFGGIDFPQGALSFADELVEYNPRHGQGNVPTKPTSTDPAKALGAPDFDPQADTGFVTLGSGGRIVLRFINNKLTGSNSAAPDIHIFEIGPDVEDTFVEISKDGVQWHSVGKVLGATSSIDIDAFGFTSQDEFTYVRLTDDPNEGDKGGATPGADIDAVGAISTAPVQHSPHLDIQTAVLVQFQSLPGSSYVIQASTDLRAWSDTVTGIQGDGTVKKFFFEITEPRKFYRVKPPE